MNTELVILLFIIGLILIVKGGDFFVDAAVWIAKVSGIPNFIIGATIVSIATTMPELIVSLLAAGKGSVDMAAGNAVGSVTVNTAMIMGISILFMPAIVKRSQMAVKMLLMCASIAVLWIFSFNASLSIVESIIMICFYLFFIWENVRTTKQGMSSDQEKEEEKEKIDRRTVVVNAVKFILGVVGIVWGADLLVDNACILARNFGIPESIIGVTIISVGTSLPELVTTITAIVKKQSSLSVGNIIGANIIDLAVILPMCSIVSGKSLPVSAQMSGLDMPMCLVVCLIAVIPALFMKRFTKIQGGILLAVYAS
ncbi:MAG: calcium/sodium antiporter [Clostridia bacterium]|nr:calcium/sodium antiporter [Clostridia bacterium]